MQIGLKIKDFGMKKFGSLKAFAAAVGKTPPDLSCYLGSNPKSMPGSPLLKKLFDLGLDLNWLFSDDEEIKKEGGESYSPSNNLLEELNRLRQENLELKKKLDKIGKLFE